LGSEEVGWSWYFDWVRIDSMGEKYLALTSLARALQRMIGISVYNRWLGSVHEEDGRAIEGSFEKVR